jgi:plasmid stabilization system protein ParE
VTHKLLIRPRADIDLASHFLYLADRSPQAALRFDSAVTAALKRIRADPEIGAMLTLPAIAHLSARFYRPKGFKNYLIVYRIAPECTYILRILHAGQDIEAALTDAFVP